MLSSATAVWIGSNTQGVGNVTTQSKILQNVFFTKVKENTKDYGTNEFELLTASISVSFTNLLGELLSKDGFQYEEIESTLELTVFREITQVHLLVKVKASITTRAQLNLLIEKAKNRSTILKILNIPVSIKF